MKRSKRMQTVERVVSDTEKKRAESLGASERKLNECEARLTELETYQKNYADQFNARAGAGMGALGLRDYQTFMTRLAEAVKQQTQLVLKAREDRDAELGKWQSAAKTTVASSATPTSAPNASPLNQSAHAAPERANPHALWIHCSPLFRSRRRSPGAWRLEPAGPFRCTASGRPAGRRRALSRCVHATLRRHDQRDPG